MILLFVSIYTTYLQSQKILLEKVSGSEVLITTLHKHLTPGNPTLPKGAGMSVAVVRNDENENLELPPDREGIQRKRCRLHQRLNGQHLQGNLAVLAVRCMQVPITPQNMFVVSAELDEVDLATIHLCKET